MRVLVKRNIKLFFQKGKYLLVPTICMLIFLISNFERNGSYFLAMSASNDGINLLITSLFLVINFSYLLITYYLYQYDMEYQKEVIFLRVSYKKWFGAYLVSLLVINLLLVSFYTVFYSMFGLITGCTVVISWESVIFVYLSKIILQLIYVLFLRLTKELSLFIIGVLLLIPILLKTCSIIYVGSLIGKINSVSVWFLLVFSLVLLLGINLWIKDRNLIIGRK